MQPPLSRNRNYQLLWGSRMLSGFGLSSAGIAFPLLVLTVTGSAAESGVVLGTIAATQISAGLPAGVLADRWNRKYIMVGCEAMLAAAAASLVVALIGHALTIPHVIVVAGVIGVCGGLFDPAESASLPNLVQDRQVSTALAMNFARSSLGNLSGTAAGGFLFAVGRAVPFVADMASHAAACSALIFLRLPVPPARPQPAGNLRREMLEGLHWVWQQRLIRVLATCALVLNFFFTAFYLVIIVLARRRGIPSGEIGVMAAMLGAGGVAGSLLAPYLHKKLSPFTSIASVFWVFTALTPTAILIHSGYLMGALFFGIALLPPTANTTILTRLLLITPDHLRGRLSGVIGLIVGAAAAVGPMLGGVLIEVLPSTQAVLICAAGIAAITAVVTVNPTLRHFPRLESADDNPTPIAVAET
ncbi:MAG TPA: MFS transporter [Streptosporangiaceae bacterium]|nr:MFS transporter [Streptosporangiaceae bacterium]